MSDLHEEKINPYVIDFEKMKDKSLNEVFLRMFGGLTKWVLKRMYGKEMLGALVGESDADVSAGEVRIVGKPEEVRAYVKALEAEKEHIRLYNEYGPDHPRTARAKAMLDMVVKKFERATELPWPIE
jgi:hypothetical protein